MNREDWNRAKNNAIKLENEINRLSDIQCVILLDRYREFFALATEIRKYFKDWTLLREDRNRLWNMFDKIHAPISAEYGRLQENRRYASENNKDMILKGLRETYFQARGARNLTEINQARTMLEEVLSRLKNSADNSAGTLLPKDRDECWTKVKEVRETIHDRRTEINNLNFQSLICDAREALNEADSGDPRKAKALVRQVQNSLKGSAMHPEQYAQIRLVLDKAWQTADGCLKEMAKEREHRQQEFKGRMEDKIQHLQSLIRQKEEYISALMDQIEKCNELERGARTEDYADRVRGWRQEKQNRIDSVHSQIHDLESKIRFSEEKLRAIA